MKSKESHIKLKDAQTKLKEPQDILKETHEILKESPKKIKEYNVYDKNFIASYILRIVLIFFLGVSIWRRDWLWVIGCSFTILISFTPTILKQDFNITLPWILDLMISVTIFLHVGGIMFNLYGIIPGYDTITHFVASILIGFLAFIIIYILEAYLSLDNILGFSIMSFNKRYNETLLGSLSTNLRSPIAALNK